MCVCVYVAIHIYIHIIIDTPIRLLYYVPMLLSIIHMITITIYESQIPPSTSRLAADAFRKVRLLKQPWRLRETLQNLKVFQTSPRGRVGVGMVGGKGVKGRRWRKLGTLQFHGFWMISVIFTLFWYVKLVDVLARIWGIPPKKTRSGWKLRRWSQKVTVSDKLSTVVG